MKPGDEITTGGCMWRVLDVQEDRALIWKHTGVEDHVFNKDNTNNYEGSDIQKYLQTGFRETVPEELLSLEAGARLMTLENGLRFLADHLNGDVYFRIHRPGQNLDRARAQFALLADMERHSGEMAAVLREMSD